MTTTTAYLTAKLGASSRGLRVAGWMGPTVAGLGLAAVLAAAAGGGSHWDLEAWNLTWTLRPDDAFLIDGAPSGPVPKSPSTDGCP